MMVKLNEWSLWLKRADLLKKYTDVWINVSNGIKKKLDCKPIYIKNILKTKIGSWLGYIFSW